MRRIMLSAAFGVCALVASWPTANAAPPGGGGGSSFTLAPAPVEITTPVGVMGFDTVTVTTGKKAVVLVSPAATNDPRFTDTRGGTCWTQYAALGNKIPPRTNCTIEIGFLSESVVDDATATLIVTECTRGTAANCRSTGASMTANLSGTAIPAVLDLAVESIVFNGSAASYTSTIRNVGTAAVDMGLPPNLGPGQVHIVVQGYYSPDTTLDPDDAPACGTSVAQLLAPGESFEAEIVNCGGAPRPGDQYLLVHVDAGEQLAESDETNNVGMEMLPAGLPDLMVTDITHLGASTDFPTNYEVTVENVGTGPVDVENAVAVQGYFSVTPLPQSNNPPDLAACNAFFGTDPDFVLNPGDTVVVNIGCNVRPQPGHNYLYATVDTLSVVAESDEGNNVGYKVLPEYDLTIDTIVVDSLVGNDIQYTTTILLSEANNQQVAVEMQNLAVAGWYSADGSTPGSSACLVSQQTKLAVLPGSTFDVTITCPNPRNIGEDYLLVQIDAGQPPLVAESNELNNSDSVSLVP